MWPDRPQADSARDAGAWHLTPQLVAGLLVIAAGVLLTLDNLGVLDARAYIRFWPAGLVVVGALKVWQARGGVGGAFGGALLIAVGGWLVLERSDLVRLRVDDLWPILLVVAGGYLVWQGVAGARARAAGESNDVVHAMAVLGGVSRGNNSAAFRGGGLTAVMGGCELDLRHAAIDGEAVIDVFALWGGIEIRVPEEWTVVSRVMPLLGGVDDKTRPPQGAGRHRLILRGLVLMAGVEVKN